MVLGIRERHVHEAEVAAPLSERNADLAGELFEGSNESRLPQWDEAGAFAPRSVIVKDSGARDLATRVW